MADKRMTRREAEKLVLKSKKIKLEPIISKEGKGFFKKDHDGVFMYSGCRQTIDLPWQYGQNSYVNIFDQEGEQEAFEVLLDREDGDLNVFRRKSEFWRKAKLVIDRNGLELDLMNPMHVILYRVAKANKDIIRGSYSAAKRPSHRFVIADGELELENDNKLAKRAEEANDLMHDIKKSKTKMTNVLRLLDKKVSSNVTIDWCKTELFKIINQVEKQPGISNIDDFITAATDPQASSKIFMLDAIEAKVIIVSGGYYRLGDSSQTIIGKSLIDSVNWLDDPKNSEEKILLENKINRGNR